MTVKQRFAVGILSLSAVAFVNLMQEEWYTGTAIIPAKGDRPTVGFGSTFDEQGRPVKMGDTITPVRAVQRSLAHIQKDESALKQCVTAPLSQVEYDTLVNHEYQYGAVATCKSPMVRSVNAGDYEAACTGYLSYRYMTSPTALGSGWTPYQFDAQGRATRWRFDCSTPGNKVCSGVWKRSQGRYQACMAAQS